MQSASSIVLACALAACSAAPTPTAAKEPMPAESNRQIVRRLYADYLNPGNLDHLGDLVSDDFVGRDGVRGAAGFAASIRGLRAAFPDLTYTLEDVTAEDDRVAVRWTLRGTFNGPFRGVAPTQQRIENTGFAMFQLAHGKLIRATVETDRLGFLQAIGVLAYDPAFGPPPKK